MIAHVPRTKFKNLVRQRIILSIFGEDTDFFGFPSSGGCDKIYEDSQVMP